MPSSASPPASTNPKDFVIATLGSHSALQILKGARDEGIPNLVICKKGAEQPYKSYGIADEIITIDDWSSWDSALEEELRKRNAIIIPHGSFIAYMGHDKVKEMDVMYYGTKEILEWESDRTKERQWMEASGLKLPNVYDSPDAIDKPVIVKFHGAGGGFGYFIAKTPEQFQEVKERKYPEENDYVIQEYIVGVPLYIHYFYSPLTKELEIMSFDKRYESNADSIGRIRAEDQLAANIFTSYTVTGNIPLVVRESLLPQMFEMGQRVVDVSQKLCPSTSSGQVGKGLFGPFCLETIITRKLNIYVFEISARIVAGTNPFINGSPYTDLKYDVPMSTGRRVARDIKEAVQAGKLNEVLG
jgi:5-formaminoimidazole-4-carboxamide-1-(beta)-D-ribofuranosyl 5'-monophosphate synthetase